MLRIKRFMYTISLTEGFYSGIKTYLLIMVLKYEVLFFFCWFDNNLFQMFCEIKGSVHIWNKVGQIYLGRKKKQLLLKNLVKCP